MPVGQSEMEVDITPISQDSSLSQEELMTVKSAEQRMKFYANKNINLIQCPQCGKIHKAHHLAGLVTCNNCGWKRPQSEEENHNQEFLLQRQIKRAIEGRSRKKDYLVK